VPETWALHWEVAFVTRDVGLQATVNPVIVGGGCTVMVAVPDLVGSSVLVAFRVTGPDAPDAVKTPLLLMVPELAAHVTALL
jgi:hypothetical protein